MLRIKDENEFLECFRPMEREEVQIPSDMLFPLLIRDYVAWMEPSGHRTFLVFEELNRGQAKGIVFRRAQGAGAPGEIPASMCDFCHSVRGGGRVGLLTAIVSPNKRIGVQACRDLSCKEHLRKPNPSPNDMRESFSTDDKERRILERMRDFARKHLF